MTRTVLTEPEAQAPSAQETRPAPRPEAARGPGRNQALSLVSMALSLAGAAMVGFFVYLYGLSGLTEARAQSTLYKTFAGQLAAATAPTGPTTSTDPNTGATQVNYIPHGAPVAILDVPALGISDLVVVEGTTSGDLMSGPGHVRASALPGQSGVSVLYGRAEAFGAPFRHLMALNRGDRITVITGQGTSAYVVESFGTDTKPAPDPTANRLILETGDSAFLPGGAVQVSADLVSTPNANPGNWPSITPQERDLAGDPGSLLALALWSQALLLVSAGGAVAAHRWSRWPAFLCAAPAAFALLWAVYENLAALLPNLY